MVVGLALKDYFFVEQGLVEDPNSLRCAVDVTGGKTQGRA